MHSRKDEFTWQIRVGYFQLISQSRKVWQFWYGPRVARATFDLEEDTPLPGSLRLYFIFLSPISFQVCSLMWLWIRSSTNFSLFSLLRGPPPSAYTFKCVWRSCCVLSFAILLLRTVTIAFPAL